MPATSSGVPTRPSGTDPSTASFRSGIVEDEGHHLARKRSGGNGIDGDPLGGQRRCELAGEHVDRGLARPVREVLATRHHESVDRSDVDHPGGVTVRRRGPQTRQQRLGEHEHALDVDVEDLVETGGGEIVDRRTPRRSGVVHQDVQPGRHLGDPRDEALDPLLGGQVGGVCVTRPRPGGGQFGRGLLARLGLAGGDDHGRPGQDESLRDHPADTPRTSGDHHGLACDVEQ